MTADGTTGAQDGGGELVAFLLARIGEDEAAARAATPGPWLVAPDDPTMVTHADGNDEDDYIADAYALSSPQQRSNARHIARWDPSRVLAECDAKRRIVEPWTVAWSDLDRGYDSRADETDWRYGVHGEAHDCVLKLLAVPYADHDDYRQEWAA